MACAEAISQLFDVDRSVVTKHLSNIFKEGELMKIQFVQNLHKLRMMEKHTIISSIH